MAKPSSITTWATNPGQTADPGDIVRGRGFQAGQKLPAKWLNWILNQNGAWFTYLRNLSTDPDFVGDDFAWSGKHRFEGTGPALTEIVSLQADSLTVVNDAQVLGNAFVFGTANVAGNIELNGGEVVYQTPPTRSMYVDLASGVDTSGFKISSDDDRVALISHSNGKRYWEVSANVQGTGILFPLHLPTGATLLSVTMGIENLSVSPRNVRVQMWVSQYNASTPNASYVTGANIGNGDATIASGAQAAVSATYNLAPGFDAVDSSSNSWSVELRVPQYGNLRLYYVRVQWRDPGLRNY